MRVVVADATPLHYLILIEEAEVLARLFQKIYVPAKVRDELICAAAPPAVRTWMQHAPPWVEFLVTEPADSEEPALAGLDLGERAAILLAESLHADLVLMDDRAGAAVAQQRGLTVTGTLGVLDLASRAGLVKLGHAFARLRRTNFRYPPSLMEALLKEEEARGKG